ncbi:MAG: ACT domain-containing protein [Clostridia bacterium]|nr:ACT domain-containing protein [Clostridia bacterium]MBQ6171390.1 ACT domain-containing protein [Clostridia bacterium]
MEIYQVSVFVENKSGKLADITDVLSENGINIRALCIADTADFGILRLIVKDPQKTEKILTEHGFTVTLTRVIGAAISDTPGGLSAVLRILSDAGISIEYLYAFIEKTTDRASVILRVDDDVKAEQVLSENGIELIGGDAFHE